MKEAPATPRTGAPWKGLRPRGHAASRSWCPWSVRACWGSDNVPPGVRRKERQTDRLVPRLVPTHLCVMIAAMEIDDYYRCGTDLLVPCMKACISSKVSTPSLLASIALKSRS